MLAAVLALVGCAGEGLQQTDREITGSRSERIAKVSALIQQRAPLPSALVDAHFLEVQFGDGKLGPSDFIAYYALKIAPADIPRWRSTLTPAVYPGGLLPYLAPVRGGDWWVRKSEYASLEFFEASTLTARNFGWVGLHAPSATIYILTMSE